MEWSVGYRDRENEAGTQLSSELGIVVNCWLIRRCQILDGV